MENIRNVAQAMRKKLKNNITYENIADYLENNGWTIILYDVDENDDLLTTLHLIEYARNVKSFAYRRDDVRVVFISSENSEDKRLYWIAHELGHICLHHTRADENMSAKQERAANMFAGYLIDGSKERYKIWLPIILCIIFVAGATALTVTVYNASLNQPDNYRQVIYITPSTSVEIPSSLPSSPASVESLEPSQPLESLAESPSSYTETIPSASDPPQVSYPEPNSTPQSQSEPEPIPESQSEPEIQIVNINTATAEEMQAIPQIEEILSLRIVAYREKNGPFESVDDLINVDGIGEKIFENIRPYVTVE